MYRRTAPALFENIPPFSYCLWLLPAGAACPVAPTSLSVSHVVRRQLAHVSNQSKSAH